MEKMNGSFTFGTHAQVIIHMAFFSPNPNSKNVCEANDAASRVLQDEQQPFR